MQESLSRLRLSLRLAIALSLIALITLPLWRLRDSLTLANFSLIYLLVTFVIAIWLGTLSSLVAAFFSFFCFNFFLIRPYYTLAVEDNRDLIELIVFLLVALITGQLAAYARRQAEIARYQAEEQNVLYELSSAFNQLNDREGIYEILCQMINQKLPVRDCAIISPSHQPLPSQPDQATFYALLQANKQIYGTLKVSFGTVPSLGQQRFLRACAVQAAMALQRIDLSASLQRTQAIEEADRLKTTLLHAVSHNLRTPITIIKTAANNLHTLDNQLTPPEKQEMTQVIEQEADHLDKLVGNLLDMSRLQAGALVLHEEWTPVSEIAGDVAALAWQRHHETRIRLNFPDDLPLVRCDYGLTLQALSNIIDNVLRYEPKQSQVEINGRYTDQEVQLIIINHGPTITLEEKEHIMEPFYHGQDGHVGLGLAISKGIVEAHHGRLSIEDTPGGGATFIISLPRAPIEGVA